MPGDTRHGWTYNISVAVAITDAGRFEIRDVARVRDGSVTVIPSHETLEKLNMSICGDIHAILTSSFSAGHMKEPKLYAVGDIQAVMFYVFRWRRCTGFVVLQKSPMGNRLVCYFADPVFHDGASFGTDCKSAFSNHSDFGADLWRVYRDWLKVYLPLAKNTMKVYNMLTQREWTQGEWTRSGYQFGV